MWQLRGVGRLLAKGFAAGGVLSIVLCGSTVAHVDRLDVDDDGTGCDGTALFVDGTEADGSFTIVASDVGDVRPHVGGEGQGNTRGGPPTSGA